MAPKSSSTAPKMRTTAPTLSSRAGLEGFTVTGAYACGPAERRSGRRRLPPRSPCSGPGTGRWGGSRAPRAPPGAPSAAFPPQRSWHAGAQRDYRGAGPSPRGSTLPARTGCAHPDPRSTRSFRPGCGSSGPAHAHIGHPPSHSRWLKSLTRPVDPDPAQSPGPAVDHPGGRTARDSPGGCKTRRPQAPPGRWALCPSSLPWLRTGERGTGRLRARPGRCPAAHTQRPSRLGQPSVPHPFQRLTSLLPALLRPTAV